MYDFKSRVRYSEVNSEKEMTLPALIDYLQNCCTFQSEDMNVGVDYLERNHSAWVLSSWEIEKSRERVEKECLREWNVMLRFRLSSSSIPMASKTS